MNVSIRMAAVVVGGWAAMQTALVYGQVVPRDSGPPRRTEVDGPVAPPGYSDADRDIDPRREARDPKGDYEIRRSPAVPARCTSRGSCTISATRRRGLSEE